MGEFKTLDDTDHRGHQQLQDEFVTFLKEGSLYQKFRMDALPAKFANIAPKVVQLYCEDCKRENPFRRVNYSSRSKAQPEADIGNTSPGSFPGSASETAYTKDLESRVYVIALECKGCEYAQHTYWIEFNKRYRWARKIGQVPEPSIDVPDDIANALGDDVGLYKRAMICANQSFGMAACIYLRRILENRITPLLKIIKQNRIETGADKSELQRIDAIIEGKVAEEKIKLIRDVLPSSLKYEGDNPLRLAYDELSFGIHSRDEDSCVDLARKVIPTLNHVLIELSTEQKKRESRAEYSENIKQLRKERAERKEEV